MMAMMLVNTMIGWEQTPTYGLDTHKLLLLASSDHVGTAQLMFAYMKCFDRS